MESRGEARHSICDLVDIPALSLGGKQRVGNTAIMVYVSWSETLPDDDPWVEVPGRWAGFWIIAVTIFTGFLGGRISAVGVTGTGFWGEIICTVTCGGAISFASVTAACVIGGYPVGF